MATTPSVSPLGPAHLAHPSTASSTTIFSLFRSATPKASTSSAPSTKTKRASKSSPYPRGASADLPAPAYFLRDASSTPCIRQAFHSTLPPPPYHFFLDLSDDESDGEEQEQGTAIPAAAEKKLISPLTVEACMRRWDEEKRERRAANVFVQDVSIDQELRKLGL
ncbi:hypothetical protein JCM21900_000797 [Sporobolomyces salmonicolor]